MLRCSPKLTRKCPGERFKPESKSQTTKIGIERAIELDGLMFIALHTNLALRPTRRWPSVFSGFRSVGLVLGATLLQFEDLNLFERWLRKWRDLVMLNSIKQARGVSAPTADMRKVEWNPFLCTKVPDVPTPLQIE